MSVGIRLWKRYSHPHFTCIIRSLARQENGSRIRLFSSPPKSSTEPREPQVKPESGTSPPKPQAPVSKPPAGTAQKTSVTPSATSAKTQTLQVGAKPVTRPQTVAPTKGTSPSPSTGAQKAAPQKPLSPAAAAGGATGGAVAAGSRVSGAQAAAGGASSGSPQKARPSKLNVLLASGVVGGIILGILYWQTPRIRDGPTETAVEGSDSFLPVEEKSDKLGEMEANGTSKNEETVVKVVLEPDNVKVETSPADSEPVPEAQKQEEQEHDQTQHQSNSSSSSSSTVTREEEILIKSEPEADTVKIEFQIAEVDDNEVHKTTSSDVSVVSKATELSEDYLLQKGHEDIVKTHEEGVMVTNAQPFSGLDVVTAIHAAEQRQAETDSALFKERLQKLEERHQHEIKGAEQEAIKFREQIRLLEEGLKREKRSHDENLKLEKEEADAKLQNEMKLLEEANQKRVEEAQLLAMSEAATLLIEERVGFLKDIGNVKVHMEAMNAALDAKSEEAREGHEIKQLSLGSFALEDALLSGAPVEREAEALLKSTGGDPLVEVALKSLPKQVLKEGSLTPAELRTRLEEIEGTLRELALIPESGGGVLCHLIARLAAALKLPDHAVHDDGGVDSVLSQVQAYLRNGELLYAAETMARGLSGTNAEKLAEEWASQARNRAVLEQACALLRAHAAALALGDYAS